MNINMKTREHIVVLAAHYQDEYLNVALQNDKMHTVNYWISGE